MKNKNSKARMQVIFGALLFTLIFMTELYGMINYSDMFFVLIVIACVDLVFMFMMIDGLIDLSDQKKARQEEQYDSVFKSEKASYLMLKKHFEEIEDKLSYLEKASKIPTEEIINAQKGIAKVIINRNHENTDAVMNAYDELLEKVSGLENKMGSTEEIARNHTEEILEAQNNQAENLQNDFQTKLQDLVVSLKDMELRLNNMIMQNQKVVTQMPIMPATMPQYSQQPTVQAVEKKSSISEPVSIEPEAEETKTEELILEVSPEPIEEEPKLEETPTTEEEPKQEEIVEETLTAEEKPPMPDLSDPNKNLSADEIAALFENMGGDIEPEPAKEEPKPEETPIAEEKPPMPDLSDPNKNLSADEIAALFANMGA